MREDVCMTCGGTGEVIVYNSGRKQNGEIYLVGETITCTDCGGSGRIYILED